MEVTDSLGNLVTSEQGKEGGNNSNNALHKKMEMATPRVSLLDMPIELLIIIFSYLNPSTLSIVGYVCKDWYKISKDNTVWMSIFRERFNNRTNFASVSRSAKWREELISRETSLKRWKSGQAYNMTYRLRFHVVTDLQCSFDKNRIVTMSKNTGALLTATMTSGKNQSSFMHASPSGTTSFDLGKNAILYGRWDGSVYGCILHKSNILDFNLKEFTSTSTTPSSDPEEQATSNHTGMVIASLVNKSENPASKRVSAFTGDEHGLVIGWDIQNRVDSFEIKVSDHGIVKIESDFLKWVIILDNSGSLYVVKNYIKQLDTQVQVSKISNVIDVTQNASDLVGVKLLVDYGGQNIAVVTRNSLSVFSFKDGSMGSARVLDLNGDKINRSCIDVTASRLVEDKEIAGGDACNIGLVMNTGRVIIFNMRNTEYDIIPSVSFVPRLATYPKEILQVIQPAGEEMLPPISSIFITPIIVVLGSSYGKVEIYDIGTGGFMRKASVRLNARVMDGFNRHELIPVTDLCISTDNTYDCRGVICFGDIIQYFQFGDILEDIKRAKNKGKSKKKLNLGYATDRKSQSRSEIQSEYDETIYLNAQIEQENLRIDRYNGTNMDDSDEEYQMALTLSESLNTSQPHLRGSNSHSDIALSNFASVEEREEDDLRRALEISRGDYQASQHDLSLADDDNDTSIVDAADEAINGDSDDEFTRALELSRLQYNRESKRLASDTEDITQDTDNHMSAQEDEDLKLALLLSQMEMDQDPNIGSSSHFS